MKLPQRKTKKRAPSQRGNALLLTQTIDPQAEKRFFASQGLTFSGDGHHLIRRQIARTGLIGIFGECTVRADVAAQVDEGNENLARIGDHTAPLRISLCFGDLRHA